MKPNRKQKRDTEESSIKSILKSYWSLLGLKIEYFNNAMEIDKELKESVNLIKYWEDKYYLLKKDHALLEERIRELNERGRKTRKTRARCKEN